jgi:hypothetical protein
MFIMRVRVATQTEIDAYLNGVDGPGVPGLIVIPVSDGVLYLIQYGVKVSSL